MEPPRQPWWRIVLELYALSGRVARERARVALLGTALVTAAVLLLLPYDAAAKAWITRWGPSTPDLTALARHLSHWGEMPLAPTLIVVALALWGWTVRRPTLQLAAGAGLLAMITSGLMTDVLRWTFGRPRPRVTDVGDGLYWFKLSADFQSFPSGHATHCCALVAVVAVLGDAGTTAVLTALAGLVIWSRYYVLAHYPSDLLAGAWIGTAVGLAFGLAARRWLARHAARGVDAAVTGPPRWPRLAPWLLTAAGLLVLLPGTGTLPLLDRDEPRFATATREMMDRGDWIVPTFNGAERFDKPALTYWLMRAGYALCGVGESGARLPAVGAALALVLLTWHTGRRWFGEGAGLLAGFALMTCLQVLIHGRLAVADMPMVACVALVQVGVLELLTAPEGAVRRGWWWATWLALGLGLLAKGPIALVVPALSLLLFRWGLWRRPLPWARLRAGRGLLLALLVLGAWGVPALVVTQGRFWQVGIGEHVVRRGLESFNGRGYTPWFYLATAPFSLFPWIAFAGLAVAGAGARRHWDERVAWLVAWLAAPYVIFTCYATQLPHYVLPAFPAFFLLLGRGSGRAGPRAQRGGEILLAVVAGLAFVAAALVATAELPANVEPLREMAAGGPVLLLGLTVLPWAALRRRWPVLAGSLLTVGAGTWLLADGMRSASLAVDGQARWSALPVATRFVGYGVAEPSLVFYSGRHWTFADTPETLAIEMAKPGPLVVLTLVREADPLGFFTGNVRWRDEPRPPELTTGGVETEFSGFSPGRSRWQVVREWRRE